MITDQIDREALKAKLKNKRQPWTEPVPEKPEVRSTPEAPKQANAQPPLKEKRAAVKPILAHLPSAPRPEIKLVAATVEFYLGVESKPTHDSVGAVFPGRANGVKAVFIKLFRERTITKQAIERGDMATVRFLGALLLVEWLCRSGYGKQTDITELWKALTAKLRPQPPDFWVNFTFWAATLAEHELTAGLTSVSEKPVLWFSIVAELPVPSTMRAWNPNLPAKQPKPKTATPEGEKPNA